MPIYPPPEYMVNASWSDALPRMGQISGVSLDPISGNLLVFHRGAVVWGGATFRWVSKTGLFYFGLKLLIEIFFGSLTPLVI